MTEKIIWHIFFRIGQEQDQQYYNMYVICWIFLDSLVFKIKNY